MERYHNYFANINLVYPLEQADDYARYTQSGGAFSADRSPLPRMVDFWFLAISLAAREGLTPVDLSAQETSNFITGAIFDRDSWRVQFVMLIAVEIEGTVDVVADPRRMMAIANGLAAAGVPRLVDLLLKGNQEPIWNLSDALHDILEPQATGVRGGAEL